MKKKSRAPPFTKTSSHGRRSLSSHHVVLLPLRLAHSQHGPKLRGPLVPAREQPVREERERERERRIGAKWGDSLDAPLLSRKPRPLKTSQKQKTNFQLSLQPLVRAHEGRRPELLRQAQEPAGAQVPVDRLRRQPRAGEERVVVAFFSFPFRQLPSGLSNFVVGGLFRLAQRLFFSFVSLPHASFALRFSLCLSRNSKKRNRPTKSSASTPGRSLSR